MPDAPSLSFPHLMPGLWLSSIQEINSLADSSTFFSLPLFLSPFSTLESLSSPDNTARILTRRSGFGQQEQSVFYLPILIADSGQPVLSSTGTLTIQVCSCDDDGQVLSCSPEAYMLPVSLSRGALIAILACIFVLLGEQLPPFYSVGSRKCLLSYHSAQLFRPIFYTMLIEKVTE